MKQYVALFENFEEAFDDFYQSHDTKSDRFFMQIAKELIELAEQYTNSESPIDVHSEKYGTATRIHDLQNDLIVYVNDTMGERMAEDFAIASDDMLKSYNITEAKKSAPKKDKLFSKTDNVPDNGILNKSTKDDNLEKPTGKQVSLRPRKTKNPR